MNLSRKCIRKATLAAFLLGSVCSFAIASEPISTNDPSVSSPLDIKFELDIQPILTARGCNAGACHGKARGQNGFALSLLGFDANMDFDAIVKNTRGRRLSFAAPQDSLLLMKATGKLPHGGGIRFSETDRDYQLLLDWIRNGTNRTNSKDPILVSLHTSPEPHSLEAGQAEALCVTAKYSDGTTRDVTRMCAYQSNEPAVVEISNDGRLQAGMIPGEASIMVRYMGMITTWSTAVPNPKPVPLEQYSALPRGNFIDEHVYQKLAGLHILPSHACNESQFLKRLYLDAIGRLPTADEVNDYLADRDINKKSTWVTNVLARPEYADYWANKWADLLRPNPFRVGVKTTYSLDAWLRDAFRKNIPHDQFVRRIVTAQGSTWRNGAVTVFRDRREPEEITTLISQLFLGLRLECAKCHQHPFEVYGQSDFYGMSAHFARVGYKGTGLSPPISGSEEIVYVKAKGEVKHPLTNEVVLPKPIHGEAHKAETSEDPRVHLAEWMISPDNPTFANVAVNRLWGELMGVGIVDPIDDFRATNPPSNGALLDALADHFRQIGYDNKKLLHTIFTSHIYSLSSEPNETNLADHRNFSRHYRKRLRGEVLSDALSDITGQPENFEGMPRGTRAVELWTVRTESELLDTFGRPDPNQDPPCERATTSTMTQTLHLMNAEHLQRRISADGGRCHKLATSDKEPVSIVRELYLTIFSRLPDQDELTTMTNLFTMRDPSSLADSDPVTYRRHLIEDVVWSMCNSPEFLYLD